MKPRRWPDDGPRHDAGPAAFRGDVHRGHPADRLVHPAGDRAQDLGRAVDLGPEAGQRLIVGLALQVPLVEADGRGILLLVGLVAGQACIDREEDQRRAQEEREDEFGAGDGLDDLFLDDVFKHEGPSNDMS